MQLELSFAQKNPSVLDGLNERQLEAVTHKDGPLLIIAGAGTGKTTVITRRIAYIIERKWAKPSEILALTFTEKAAAEMEERVDRLVPYGFVDMWISTFHAFGDHLLRDFALDLGLPANFNVLTAPEQAIFMRQNIYAFDLNYYRPIANPLSHIEALLKHFSRLKDELITPREYLHYAKNHYPHPNPLPKGEGKGHEETEKTLELAKAYERYSELMAQAGNLDFGDQIFLTYKLLKENKQILKNCKMRFKYILVDEYQDTNYAQNEIVKLLAGKTGNITAVADDDQSIYRFRGASISNVLQFKDSYTNVKQIVLNQNYRSTQEILNSSYTLIQFNNPDRLEYQNKIDKRLISPRRGTKPELLYADTLSVEADLVAKKIIELKKKRGYRYNEFALLVRANSQAEPFIQSLNLRRIPYIFSGTANLFAQPEVGMLIAFFKCLVYPDDNISLYQLATSELYAIEPEQLAPFYAAAKRRNRSMEQIIDHSFNRDSNLFEQDRTLGQLILDLNKYRIEIKSLNAGELLYKFLSAKGYLKKISLNPGPAEEIKIRNIAKFFDRISQFNRSSTDQSILAFLLNLELLMEYGQEAAISEIDPDIEAINILTVHAAKGLEWPAVFIVNAVADRFPSRNKRDPLEIPEELIREKLPRGDFHLEEERRLFYVACTRAKDLLFLTAAQDYGGKRAKKLSQFVLELLDQPNPIKIKNKTSAIAKIDRFKQVRKITTPAPPKLIDGKIRLSRQKIDDYFTCPKKYYFAHIVGIPLLQNQYLMYGTAIHAALDHYFHRLIRGENPTVTELLADFRQAFHSVGFITREHEEQRYRTGLEALTAFYRQDQAQNFVPTEVESPFIFSTNDVIINGRFDLVYGSKENAEIRDFKTSNVIDQKDADRRLAQSTQMKIYALAWREKNRATPKTTLYFIESSLVAEKTFSDDDLDQTKAMITEVAAGIKAGDMSAKPELFACTWCPFKEICSDSVAK